MTPNVVQTQSPRALPVYSTPTHPSLNPTLSNDLAIPDFPYPGIPMESDGGTATIPQSFFTNDTPTPAPAASAPNAFHFPFKPYTMLQRPRINPAPNKAFRDFFGQLFKIFPWAEPALAFAGLPELRRPDEKLIAGLQLVFRNKDPEIDPASSSSALVPTKSSPTSLQNTPSESPDAIARILQIIMMKKINPNVIIDFVILGGIVASALLASSLGIAIATTIFYGSIFLVKRHLIKTQKAKKENDEFYLPFDYTFRLGNFFLIWQKIIDGQLYIFTRTRVHHEIDIIRERWKAAHDELSKKSLQGDYHNAAVVDLELELELEEIQVDTTDDANNFSEAINEMTEVLIQLPANSELFSNNMFQLSKVFLNPYLANKNRVLAAQAYFKSLTHRQIMADLPQEVVDVVFNTLESETTRHLFAQFPEKLQDTRWVLMHLTQLYPDHPLTPKIIKHYQLQKALP